MDKKLSSMAKRYAHVLSPPLIYTDAVESRQNGVHMTASEPREKEDIDVRTSIRFHNFTVITRRAVTPSISLNSMSATATPLKLGESGVTLPDQLLTFPPLQPARPSPINLLVLASQPARPSPTSLLVVCQPGRSSFASPLFVDYISPIC